MTKQEKHTEILNAVATIQKKHNDLIKDLRNFCPTPDNAEHYQFMSLQSDMPEIMATSNLLKLLQKTCCETDMAAHILYEKTNHQNDRIAETIVWMSGIVEQIIELLKTDAAS